MIDLRDSEQSEEAIHAKNGREACKIFGAVGDKKLSVVLVYSHRNAPMRIGRKDKRIEFGIRTRHEYLSCRND